MSLLYVPCESSDEAPLESAPFVGVYIHSKKLNLSLSKFSFTATHWCFTVHSAHRGSTGSVPNLWLSSSNLWLLKSFNPTMYCGSLIHLIKVVATERSQLNHIELSMNTLVFERDSAGFFSGNNYSFNSKL